MDNSEWAAQIAAEKAENAARTAGIIAGIMRYLERHPAMKSTIIDAFAGSDFPAARSACIELIKEMQLVEWTTAAATKTTLQEVFELIDEELQKRGDIPKRF